MQILGCSSRYLLLGGIHKLRLQDLAFFDHLPPSVYIFYGIKCLQKNYFFDHLPPPLVNVVCERPLAEIFTIVLMALSAQKQKVTIFI